MNATNKEKPKLPYQWARPRKAPKYNECSKCKRDLDGELPATAC